MTTESKTREFLLKKKEKQTIDAGYNAIEARPESECDPKDIEAEKILKYIRVIEKSFADKLQAEIESMKAREIAHLALIRDLRKGIKAKDELLRECEEMIIGGVSHWCVHEDLKCELCVLLNKLREGKND